MLIFCTYPNCKCHPIPKLAPVCPLSLELKERLRRRPKPDDPNYLDGDYDMIGSFQATDWGE